MCRAPARTLIAPDPTSAAKTSAHKPKLIRVHDKVYDVQNFKHPGGNILDFFQNIDATPAYEAFHGHSKKANLMLKSLPLAKDQTAVKHSNHTQAIVDTFVDWRKRGLFDPKPLQAGTYAMAVMLAIALSWRVAPTFPVLAGLLVGTAWAHCGFLQHMGGHRELGAISLPWQNFFEGLLKGGSGSWWRNRHNKHHAKTNVLGQDGDLRTTPFFAWDATLARKVPDWSLRTQAFTFLPALGAYVFVFALTVRKFIFVRKLWLEASLVAGHYVLFASALRAAGCSLSQAATYYCVGYAFQGIYLGFFFGLSHFAAERLAAETSWLDQACIGTIDWNSSSAFCGYLSGFLNTQIEHHMAPQMPMENLRVIAPECKKLAQQFGLPYRDVTFVDAVKYMFNGLYKTGRDELARRKEQRLIPRVVGTASVVLEQLHQD